MKTKSVFICTKCEYQTTKWLGKCPSCGNWNTFEEQTLTQEAPSTGKSRAYGIGGNMISGIYSSGAKYGALNENIAAPLDSIDIPEYLRESTGLGELDRVLGGGLVQGSVVLLSGEPGIGKSTLLMQVSSALASVCDVNEDGEVTCERRVMYVSGEESRGQLKLRSKRLGTDCGNVFILCETNIDTILTETDKIHPDVIIIDSIQTIYCEAASSAPGSVTQVREATGRLIAKAKNEGISIILIGHVNKEGGIAGPKVLEHMVDSVLYFEGERTQQYRIIRAIKNRFGSTNEIGMFEMSEVGLVEVENPSEALLAGRPKDVSGSCAVCIMEGTRPIIAEIQALVTPTVFPSPRRTSNGIDYNRIYMLLAVLEKRLGLRFSAHDVYINVISGLRVDEPASDIAVALALISSLRDAPVPDELCAVGELGLSGECRAVSNLEQRIREAYRLGFKKIIIPSRIGEKSLRALNVPDIELIPITSIFDTLKIF